MVILSMRYVQNTHTYTYNVPYSRKHWQENTVANLATQWLLAIIPMQLAEFANVFFHQHFLLYSIYAYI